MLSEITESRRNCNQAGNDFAVLQTTTEVRLSVQLLSFESVESVMMTFCASQRSLEQGDRREPGRNSELHHRDPLMMDL